MSVINLRTFRILGMTVITSVENEMAGFYEVFFIFFKGNKLDSDRSKTYCHFFTWNNKSELI